MTSTFTVVFHQPSNQPKHTQSHTFTSLIFHIEKLENEVLDLPGFWQSWRYFEHCKDVIIGLLTPTNLHPIRWGMTSIHIRRGDYAGQYKNAFAQIGLDYYHRAMEVVRSPKYLIVSDDIPWCKQNFRGEQFEFSDGKSED